MNLYNVSTKIKEGLQIYILPLLMKVVSERGVLSILSPSDVDVAMSTRMSKSVSSALLIISGKEKTANWTFKENFKEQGKLIELDCLFNYSQYVIWPKRNTDSEVRFERLKK